MQQEPQFLPTGVPRGVGGGLSGQVGACWFPLGAQGLGGGNIRGCPLWRIRMIACLSWGMEVVTWEGKKN